MGEVALVLLLMMISVYVGLNEKIENNFKTGYFVVVLFIVIVMVLVKLLGGNS